MIQNQSMRSLVSAAAVSGIVLFSALPAKAALMYWNLFNIEGENTQNSVYVTYTSLADMLTDSNRTGSFVPNTTGGSARNVVGTGSDGSTYWSLFNIEGENTQNSVYITYTSLADMLTDSNRTGSFVPNTTGGSARNVVGTGSDGSTYWSLFNIEGENTQNSVYITYTSLADMLTDSNRTGSFVPNTTGGSARNVVGGDSDGSTYWNLFNIEGENQQNAVYITYASRIDMLNDTNRTGSFVPNTTGGSARNVVGSGASVMPKTAIPEPAALTLFCAGLLGLGIALRNRKRQCARC